MYDFQGLIFRAATRWSEATALAVFGIGLLYTLQGFRFARFLLPVSCAGGGFVLGGILAGLAGLPSLLAVGVAAGLGIVALLRYRVALILASAFTLGALAEYLAAQVGCRPNMAVGIGVGGLVVGSTLFWVCRRPLPILVTIVQGAGLLVVAFVSITSTLVPSLGLTFQDWSTRVPLMVPGLMVMLCVLGYSVQANAQQGTVETGGNPGIKDLETW